MEIVSKANSVRISPKKLRKVADLVRGLNVNKALNSLSHMDEKGAAIILKTLSSAIANACLLYTSPSPRDGLLSRMPSSA